MISFIFAMDEQRVIGRNNDLPWKLPADLAHFKRTTIGSPVVMGRKTFESMGSRPLPGRRNIVVTSNPDFHAEGCEILRSVKEIPLLEEEGRELFVIGGAKIFEEMLPHCTKMYVTLIHHSFDGDTFFPPFNETEWETVSKERGIKDEKNPYTYEFLELKRIK
ncbi:dihydrofolate reductase [Bacillus sp. FJAT-42376]|uniref:dihydrofolate reductase n=1 Tax=Bacillus sp. FJAT-42376 TaxID=2014076 RepID=UPI000F4F6E8D|nr:dihydrofolate reductase [Bacillus sp. FJAT-42376]AZB43254.1 dihydrofolate reductase [Bacillus sp. FJAT-42376]